MKKIIVIGCPGSGKSTFSRALHEKTGIPLFHLDMMYWNSDRTTVEKTVFREHLSDVIKRDEWIIDGNYISTMEARMEACDTVFFLDYPTELCLASVEARMRKPRPDMPWIETEWDEEFREYIKAFEKENRPKIFELLEKHKEKALYLFHSRKEAEEFLNSMKA